MSVTLEPRGARSTGGARGGRADAAVWGAFAVMGLLLAAYTIFLVARTDQRFSPWLDGWLVVAFEMIASGLCIASGVRHADRRRRAVAFVLGAACLSWAIGDLALTIETISRRGAAPGVPSVADGFYLGFFPIAFVAVVLLVRNELRQGERPNWLDGAIATLGMAAICAGFAFHGLEHLVEGVSLASATNLAYPVGDLLLLGIVAGSTVMVGDRSRPTLVLVAVGLAVNAAGDTFNFAGGGSTVGTVVNAIAWPTSILVIAVAMWVWATPSSRIALRQVSGFAIPGVVTIASLGILAAGSWYRFGPIAIVLATVTLVLAGARLAYRPALERVREQLRSSERRYRSLFERNPQPMVAYDRETMQIVAVSNAMVAAYGYTQAELLAMRIHDLLPDEDVAGLLAWLASHPDGTSPEQRGADGYPSRHKLRDGTIIDIEVSSTNVELDGRACRIAHFDDVTERNRAAAEIAVARDQAVEASNTKSVFLANVSHEIRTPMNGVLGMTELLLGTPLNDEQREYAEQVGRSGEQMLAIINDILDLSKIETGHLELDIVDFDLHEMIMQTCSAAGAQARAKGLRLEMMVGTEVPRRARGDGRRIGQVLLNLVSNAIKFTPAGSISVAVEGSPAADGATRVRVAVTDSGIGIKPESLTSMFEPFTQADASTTRLYGGTGLGLAISRELIEMMGGTIGATSEVGTGSTFWFELELAAPVESELRATTVPMLPTEPLSWDNAPLVLIAEDSQINQIVAARALERCGCRTRVVGDGREALDALSRERFDAVLMDCQMPNLDGYEATGELRRREAGGERTPVIAMTAHAMDGDRRRCLEAGMDDYISKPMRYADLIVVLARWVPSLAAIAAPTTPPPGGEQHPASVGA